MPNVRPLNKKKYGISKHAFGTAYSYCLQSSMGQADSQDHRGADLWIQRGRCNTGKTERIPAGFQGYAGFRTDMVGYIRASGAL